MKVAIEKAFPLPGSADVAWAFLQDIEAVAGCMPGAKITERTAEGAYKGTVAVRVGPVAMSFRGTVEVSEIDPAARSLRLLGKGMDSTGTSGASMNLLARIEPVDGGTSSLVGKSEVTMSGKAASFGGRMMNSVADQILKQFADNFALQVAARAAVTPVQAGAQSSPPVTPAQAAAGAAITPAQAAAGTAVTPAQAGAQSNELNGLALAWAVFKDWLRGLFGKKPA